LTIDGREFEVARRELYLDGIESIEVISNFALYYLILQGDGSPREKG
jgi:hypothetical protein